MDMERQAKVFNALGHPSRVRIVHALIDGPRCVCELAPFAQCSGSTLTRHLGVLREAGVIESEKHGLRIICRLRLTCLTGVMRCLVADAQAECEGGCACKSA